MHLNPEQGPSFVHAVNVAGPLVHMATTGHNQIAPSNSRFDVSPSKTAIEETILLILD